MRRTGANEKQLDSERHDARGSPLWDGDIIGTT
jgi:hypothetical protein